MVGSQVGLDSRGLIYRKVLLWNQTGASPPYAQQSQTRNIKVCDEIKAIIFARHQAKKTEGFLLKPELPDGFKSRVFKGKD